MFGVHRFFTASSTRPNAAILPVGATLEITGGGTTRGQIVVAAMMLGISGPTTAVIDGVVRRQ